jgi:hypothetical protein
MKIPVKSGLKTLDPSVLEGLPFAAAALLACCFAHAGPVSWSGTHKAEITDPQYQMTAFTLDVPAGWKFAGTIARDPGCHSGGPGLKFTMQSPDGGTAIAALPGMYWSWTTSASLKKIMDTQHCPAIDIDSAAGFLVNIAVPNLRPHAKIVAVLPLGPAGQAALADQLEKKRQQSAQMAKQFGQAAPKLGLDGARVRIEYASGGQTIEEQLLSVVDCTETQFPAVYAQPGYMRRSCSSRNISITRAPKGQLDALLAAPQLANLNKSIQPNPAWDSRVTQAQTAAFQKFQAANNAQFQANLQKGRDDNARLLANGRAFQDNLKASTDQAMANDRARQNAIDASAHATALNSLDRQEFKNPSTGQVIEASNQYSHQWLSSDGSTLIQTNDHGYDPNGQVYPVSQSWTELTPK